MIVGNKLNVGGSVPRDGGKKYALRLQEELAEWVDENTTGSQNSVINFLVRVGINQVTNILEHDSLYESIDDKE